MKAKQLEKRKATGIDIVPRENFIPDAGISVKHLCKKLKDSEKGLLVKRPLKEISECGKWGRINATVSS